VHETRPRDIPSDVIDRFARPHRQPADLCARELHLHRRRPRSGTRPAPAAPRVWSDGRVRTEAVHFRV